MSYEEERARLTQLTPKSLPGNAAESGLGADLIQEKFYAGIFYLHDLLQGVRTSYAAADATLSANITTLQNSLVSLAARVTTLEANPSYYVALAAQVEALQTLTANHTSSISSINSAITTITANINTLKSDIQNGVISAYKAIRDGDGNVIKTTYATKAELTTANGEITKIKNGDTTVMKATKDQNGDIIDTTYVKKSQIVDALNDTSTTAPLSAAQGKALKDALDTLSNYIYNGAANTSIDRLAEVFAFLTGHDDDETLDGILAGKISFTDIVDNLTTENSGKPLSAKQGKVLEDHILLRILISDIIDNLTSDATNKPLSAKQGKALKALIDALSTDKADASAVYTKEGAEDMVDGKIAALESVNVIADEDNNKNYTYQIKIQNGKAVMYATEVE